MWDVGAWCAVKSKHRTNGNPSVYWDNEKLNIVTGREPKCGEDQLTHTDERGLPDTQDKPSSIFGFLDALLPGRRKEQLLWMEQLEANWNNKESVFETP